MQVSPDEPDFYSILGVRPDCDPKQLDLAYKALAKQYHPDHSASADLERFKDITAAYRVLRDPLRRLEYDDANPHLIRGAPRVGVRVAGIDQGTIANDAIVHDTILMHLYNLRRQNIDSVGAGEWQLIDLLGCSQRNFEFHAWYLREKGYIRFTEDGTWAITIAGVDYIIETMRSRQDTIRLITQAVQAQREEPVADAEPAADEADAAGEAP